MKTQGEIEAAICEGISRFEQEYRGRGPKDIHAYLLGDFVVVRLQGLLTPAEQQLAKFPSEKGRDLLKQVRTHLIETAKPLLQALVQGITGVKVVSLHHDISTVTGEAFVILTLAESPSYRQAQKAPRCPLTAKRRKHSLALLREGNLNEIASPNYGDALRRSCHDCLQDSKTLALCPASRF